MQEIARNKQETSPEAVAEILEKKKVGSAGMLLMAVEAARRKGLWGVEEEFLGVYMFLLKGLGFAPTHYSFRFNPLPSSEELEGDLGYLREADHLLGTTPLAVIGQKGTEFVKEHLGPDEEIVLNAFGNLILGWSRLDSGELFNRCADSLYQK